MADIDYPASWYAATRDATPERPSLTGRVAADVAIVGGGFAGLHTARLLAMRGLQGGAGRAAAHRLGRLGPQRRLRRAGLCPAHGRPDRAAGRGPCPPALRPVAARRGNRARVAEGDGATRHPDGLGPALGLAHRPGAGLRRAVACAGRQARRHVRALGDRPGARPARSPSVTSRGCTMRRASRSIRSTSRWRWRPTPSAAACRCTKPPRRGPSSAAARSGSSGRPWARSRRAMSCWRATPISAASIASAPRSCRWRPMSR